MLDISYIIIRWQSGCVRIHENNLNGSLALSSRPSHSKSVGDTFEGSADNEGEVCLPLAPRRNCRPIGGYRKKEEEIPFD